MSVGLSEGFTPFRTAQYAELILKSGDPIFFLTHKCSGGIRGEWVRLLEVRSNESATILKVHSAYFDSIIEIWNDKIVGIDCAAVVE